MVHKKNSRETDTGAKPMQKTIAIVPVKGLDWNVRGGSAEGGRDFTGLEVKESITVCG